MSSLVLLVVVVVLLLSSGRAGQRCVLSCPPGGRSCLAVVLPVSPSCPSSLVLLVSLSRRPLVLPVLAVVLLLSSGRAALSGSVSAWPGLVRVCLSCLSTFSALLPQPCLALSAAWPRRFFFIHRLVQVCFRVAMNATVMQCFKFDINLGCSHYISPFVFNMGPRHQELLFSIIDFTRAIP